MHYTVERTADQGHKCIGNVAMWHGAGRGIANPCTLNILTNLGTVMSFCRHMMPNAAHHGKGQPTW